jgi:RNA polymerase sigma factor (sigma-70 family)
MDHLPLSSPQQLIDHLFRHQSGKMIAVLSRIFGIHNLSMVEDVVQEAFLKAVQLWPINPLPENPSGWLMQTARNKAIDIIRRQQNFQQYSKELSFQLQQETEIVIEHFFLDSEIADSQLRLIFACCHPSLKEEDQVALTLKTVSGFGAGEIAKALITSEATIQKRLYRSKQFIKKNNIQLEIPTGKELLQRLETVYTILYLLFNEGYNSSKSGELIRRDLCGEAMRLCLLLSEHKTGKQPATFALLSLMCFQASRFESRIDENNSIILLQHQDRSKWNHDLIGKGYEYLSLSSEGEHISIYHIESAIAAEHCLSKNFAETNWHRMLDLYDLLLIKKNIPTVILNRAIVLAHLNRIAEAIVQVENIENIDFLIQTQYIYSAVLGDLYLKQKEYIQAEKYLTRAYQLTISQPEKSLITEKLSSLKRND